MSHDLQPQRKNVKKAAHTAPSAEELPDLAHDVDMTEMGSVTLSSALDVMQSPPLAQRVRLTRAAAPQTMLQLQRTVGNQAATRALAGQMTRLKGDVDALQRWPAWLDKLVGKPKYKKLEEAPPSDDSEAQEQVSHLEKIKQKLQPWAQAYAIHTNYKKYADLIGQRAWKTAMKVWEYVNKVLGIVSNLDPTGITKAVAEVSKLIKMLAGYVTEAYEMLTDSNLIEQLTPLLEVSIIDVVVGSIKELKGIWDTGSDAWDAVTGLI